MRITHIFLFGQYNDDWSYQENIMSKYHAKLGNDVSLITTSWMYDENGQSIETNNLDYIDRNNVHIIRLPIRHNKGIDYKFKRFDHLYETIRNLNPEIIFLHCPQFIDSGIVAKYVKDHKIKLYVDNHADFANSATNPLSKYILHGIIWRYYVKKLEPECVKFYGVLPARVDFLIDVYRLPKDKVELLVMGADDDKVEEAKKKGMRKIIRDQYSIKDSDIVLLTGGKIDKNKPEVLLLMKAVSTIKQHNIKLIVFGSVADEYKEEFNILTQAENIIYCGWIAADRIYEYFDAADLVLFPGLHSVLWEQAVGFGKACVFREIEGFKHVDIGGNCAFFDNLTVDGIKETLEVIINENRIDLMTKRAQEIGQKVFSYREIARRSIS